MIDKNIVKHRIKFTTKIRTINDLLTRDDINQMIEDLNNNKVNIKHLSIIYTTKDDTIYSEHTEDSMLSSIIYQIEVTKNELLKGDEV
jgi:hypothetical protein